MRAEVPPGTAFAVSHDYAGPDWLWGVIGNGLASITHLRKPMNGSNGEVGPSARPAKLPLTSGSMSENEQRLLELLKTRSFQRGQFRLASGETSDYFIDGKMTEVYSKGAYLIGEVLYEWTKDVDINAIGGLQVGAVPLSTAAVISYHHRGQTMEGFWVREAEVKSHGTQKRVEGGLRKVARVAIVDDVITKGGSALKAIEAVREFGV